MAKRILVPLDQSPAAEATVSVVADAARGSQATVRLLTVAPEPKARVANAGPVLAHVAREVRRLEAEAQDYLSTVELQLDGIDTERVVRFGDPATEILREAEAFDADLIAVTSAGQSGSDHLLLGGVAESVVRKAHAAVMLLRPARRPGGA